MRMVRPLFEGLVKSGEDIGGETYMRPADPPTMEELTGPDSSGGAGWSSCGKDEITTTSGGGIANEISCRIG